MARGKYSARAVNQARDERDSGLRRARHELAAVTRRAEIAEARAALIPNLEKRISDLVEERENDQVLKELAAAIAAWRDTAEMHRRYVHDYREAWMEAVRDVCRMAGIVSSDPKRSTDAVEYIQRRWPHLLRYTDGDRQDHIPTFGVKSDRAKKLSPEALRRLQRIRGLRLTTNALPGEDFSEALVKLLDEQAVEETAP